ncbi:unnamed protein product, partial [Staurois parvus]
VSSLHSGLRLGSHLWCGSAQKSVQAHHPHRGMRTRGRVPLGRTDHLETRALTEGPGLVGGPMRCPWYLFHRLFRVWARTQEPHDPLLPGGPMSYQSAPALAHVAELLAS